jgi:hypothetical protein
MSPTDWGPEAQAMRAGHDANGVRFLMLTNCFPAAEEVFRALSGYMQGFLIDDWLEKQTPTVVAEMEGWWGRLLERW